MKHSTGTFLNHQGIEIFTQQWLPDGEPKAGVILVHGLAEHGGRYAEMGRYFSNRNIAFYTLDHPGHGRSGGTRVYVDQFMDFTATVRQFQINVLSDAARIPLFLYGHSMGGLISTHYLSDYQDDFNGAILSAPLAKVPSNISGVTILMGKLLSRLIPKTPLVAIDSDGITSDPTANRIYDDDELVHRGKTTARLAAELLGAMQGVPAAAAEITLPAFVIQGDSDPLVDPEYGPYLHGLLASSDKTVKLYPGLYHEIHQEAQKAQVFDDVIAWIEKHLP